VDVQSAVDLHHNIKVGTQKECGQVNNIKLLEWFAHTSDEVSWQLFKNWWHKVWVVCHLALDELTLGLNDAYGPDKVFLTNTDWVHTSSWFKHGMPRKFNVLIQASQSLSDIGAPLSERSNF